MKLEKDLRTLNEGEVVEIIKWLKQKTNNFNKWDKELFEKNPQLILLLRVASGLTRASFARKICINLKTLRKIEEKRSINRVAFDAWAKKITEFLRKNKIEFDKSEFLKRWENLKKRNFEDFDKKLFETLLKEFKEMNLPDDLRKMNEKQFIKVVKWVKNILEKNDEIPQELLMVNSQLLLVMRIMLGLSQKEFARAINLTPRWVRDQESKRRFLKDPQKIIRITPLLTKLLKKGVSLDIAISKWKEFKLFSHELFRNIRIVKISELTENEIRKFFMKIEKRTNGFRKIPLDLILNFLPETLIVIRLGLGMGHKKFAEKLGIDERWLRDREKGLVGIRLKNAKILKEKLENILANNNISLETVIENFHRFKSFIPSLNIVKKNGKIAAKHQKMTSTEKVVFKTLLEIERIRKIRIHENMDLGEWFVNVDFFVETDNKKFVIEVFKLEKLGRNLRLRTIEIDHKFLRIKKFDPEIKSVLCIFSERMKNLEKMFEKRLKEVTLGTDFILINNAEKLKNVIS